MSTEKLLCVWCWKFQTSGGFNQSVSMAWWKRWPRSQKTWVQGLTLPLTGVWPWTCCFALTLSFFICKTATWLPQCENQIQLCEPLSFLPYFLPTLNSNPLLRRLFMFAKVATPHAFFHTLLLSATSKIQSSPPSTRLFNNPFKTQWCHFSWPYF